MRVIQSTDAGFFANLCDALRHIYLAERDGEEWYVNWGPTSNYYDSTVGANAYEYFFNQPYKLSQMSHPDNKIVSGYTEIPKEHQAFRDTFHDLINRNLDYTPLVRSNYNKVKEQADFDNTLGVHIRCTDKYNGAAFGEPKSAEPLPLQMYIHLANRCMFVNKYEHIYLATDCAKTADAFTREFGSALVMINAPRSSTQEPVHTGHKHISGFHKGMSVLMDALMLSRCQYLIRSTSNVSSFAQFIAPDLCHFNVNEVLMGDKREIQYGLRSSDYENFL